MAKTNQKVLLTGVLILSGLEIIFIFLAMFFQGIVEAFAIGYSFCYVLFIIGFIIYLYNKYSDVEKNAMLDPLTQLRNRHTLQSTYKEIVNKENYYAIMLDLDDFKMVNDTMGHLYGDHVLKTAGYQIKCMFHEKYDRAFRYGGEEFLIFFKADDKNLAIKKIEDLRIAFSKIKFNKTHITFSGGLTKINSKESLDELINRIDLELYRAKKDGKDKVFYAE